MNNVYKFVSWDVPPLDQHKGSRAYTYMEKLNNGAKLTRKEKDFIQDESGIIKRMGYAYDFRPYMKKYLVKEDFVGWREAWGFDKTSIRHNHPIPSRIRKIMEMPA